MAEQARNSESMPQINEKIIHRSVQLITQDGRNLGVISKDEALRLAREAELDLVVLSERDGEAPIAKIMDFGKASYARKKQQSESRSKQKLIQIKEVQIGPKIGEHDFQTKLHKVLSFLADKKHVKIVITFRGREAVLRDQRGAELYAKIDAAIEAIGSGAQQIMREKDTKTPSTWSRIYYLK
jgi:translation initiation factor IF-3